MEYTVVTTKFCFEQNSKSRHGQCALLSAAIFLGFQSFGIILIYIRRFVELQFNETNNCWDFVDVHIHSSCCCDLCCQHFRWRQHRFNVESSLFCLGFVLDLVLCDFFVIENLSNLQAKVYLEIFAID